jgi:hypothetical protein
MEEQFEESI